MDALKYVGKDPSGLAKSIKVDSFGNLIHSIGKKNITGKRNGDLINNSGQITVLEVNEPFILDRLMITANVINAPYVRIFTKLDGVFVSSEITWVPSADGASLIGLVYPGSMNTLPNDLFTISSYESGKYGIYLKSPLYFCEGFKITVENPLGTTIKTAIMVTGRTL